jgi:hypothetical protein
MLQQGLPLLQGLLQGQFGGLPGGDVLNLSNHHHRLSIAIARKGGAELNPDGVSVFVQVAFLQLVALDLPAEQLRDQLQVGVEILRMRNLLKSEG